MVRSFTCNHQESSAPLDLRNINLNASQCNLLQLKVDPSSHGVDNRLRLLKDLLLHERAEVALHDLLNLHLKDDDLEQACQHARLEGRNGGGDHRHCGVGVGDGAKPLYPFGGDGVISTIVSRWPLEAARRMASTAPSTALEDAMKPKKQGAVLAELPESREAKLRTPRGAVLGRGSA